MDHERTAARWLGHALLAAVLAAGLAALGPGTARAAGATEPFDGGALSRPDPSSGATTVPDLASIATSRSQRTGTRHGLSTTSGTTLPSPTGAITGRVSGPEGKSLADAYVGAYSRASEQWAQIVTTDADGAYSLNGLPAGSYVLCFQGPDGSDLARECWSNEPILVDSDRFLANADAIRVWPGRTVTGRNAQLEHTGRITGYVTFAGKTVREGLRVSAYLRHGGWHWTTYALIDADGHFELTGLFPGTWALSLDQCCATIEARGNSSASLAWIDWRGRVLATVHPSVSGTPVVGGLLTAKPGSGRFSGLALSYQWLRDGVEIPQAVGKTYRVVGEDVDAELSVVVTSSRSTDNSSQTGVSRPTRRVARTDTPTIQGSAQTGSTLTAVPGEWTDGTSFAYTWYANGRAIKGAHAAEYVVPVSKAGTRIRVKVTGTLADHPTLSRTSASSARVMRWTRPLVTGTPAVGTTLRARRGTWTGKASFHYQWLRDGAPIPAATRTTYRLTTDDLGTQVTLRVTGTRSGYATVAVDSESTGRVALAGGPTVMGVAAVGEDLTADTGLWTEGTSFSYEWLANGRLVAASSSGNGYRPSAADAGKRIIVRVTGTLDGYATVTRTSPATGRVAGATG